MSGAPAESGRVVAIVGHDDRVVAGAWPVHGVVDDRMDRIHDRSLVLHRGAAVDARMGVADRNESGCSQRHRDGESRQYAHPHGHGRLRGSWVRTPVTASFLTLAELARARSDVDHKCQRFIEAPSNRDLVNLVLLGGGTLILDLLTRKATINALTPHGTKLYNLMP